MGKQTYLDNNRTAAFIQMDLGITGNASEFADLGLWVDEETGGPVMAGTYTAQGKKYRASLLKDDLGLPSSDRVSKIIGFSHLGLGTGGGAPGAESDTATSLGHEVCRKKCHSRYYVEEVNEVGDFTVNGKQYSVSTSQTDKLALLFILEGAEGSYSGIDEIAVFAGVEYCTGFTQTAVPSKSSLIEMGFNRIYTGAENAIYEISIATGGEPAVGSGGPYFTVSASGTDGGQATQITSFGQEFAVGSFGLLVNFSPPTSMSNPSFVEGDTWTVYCTANHAAYDYAENGVWGVDNSDGEVLDSGYMCKVTNVTAFDKSGNEDWRHIEIVEIK